MVPLAQQPFGPRSREESEQLQFLLDAHFTIINIYERPHEPSKLLVNIDEVLTYDYDFHNVHLKLEDVPPDVLQKHLEL